jgi:hypothetical protein
VEKKRYELPEHLNKAKGLSGYKRIQQKRLTRHLRAAYLIFAKQRDKHALFQQYIRRKWVLSLAQRGKTWRRKNISIIGKNILEKESIIKQEFESRIEQALKNSEDAKKRRNRGEKVKRKW